MGIAEKMSKQKFGSFLTRMDQTLRLTKKHTIRSTVQHYIDAQYYCIPHQRELTLIQPSPPTAAAPLKLQKLQPRLAWRLQRSKLRQRLPDPIGRRFAPCQKMIWPRDSTLTRVAGAFPRSCSTTNAQHLSSSMSTHVPPTPPPMALFFSPEKCAEPILLPSWAMAPSSLT